MAAAIAMRVGCFVVHFHTSSIAYLAHLVNPISQNKRGQFRPTFAPLFLEEKLLPIYGAHCTMLLG